MLTNSFVATAFPQNRLLSAGPGLVAICLLGFFTISTGSASFLGLPLPFIMSILFSIYMLAVLRFRVDWMPTQFAFFYLAGITIGSLIAVFSNKLEAQSFVQLLSALGCFVIATSFVSKWLNVNSDDAKKRALEIAILIFAALGLVEIFFLYDWFYDMRVWLYGDKMEYQLFRDIRLYFMARPTGFFSEPSNYGRFMGILAAAYMIVSRCSFRSMFYLAFLVVLTRSPMIWYAVPAMILAVMAANPRQTLAGFWTEFMKGIKGPMILVGGFIMVAAVLASQGDRIENVQSERDGSFKERILIPLDYMIDEWKAPILGDGATAHNNLRSVRSAEKITSAELNRKKMAIKPNRNGAFAPTMLIIIAMGAVGVTIFVVSQSLILGSNGLILVGAFFLSNILNSGFNSAQLWAPSAILLSLCWYVLTESQQRQYE